LQEAKRKVECPHCTRTVNKENMPDHQKSKYCQTRLAKKNEADKMDKLKDDLKKIKEVIDSLSAQITK
jgi:hypothetical protein